ncbi:unnamed protein product [Polarella glacialis]|uniref:Uncharacterized protein n=1 Tax=Polarella glacialis TaxID=89957 RepID=A0A813KA27_POLGL|nr:unnamed protein product [Polarella glacialis]CAE8697990.1 unnamed protein product [Polarella glacialis]
MTVPAFQPPIQLFFRIDVDFGKTVHAMFTTSLDGSLSPGRMARTISSSASAGSSSLRTSTPVSFPARGILLHVEQSGVANTIHEYLDSWSYATLKLCGRLSLLQHCGVLQKDVDWSEFDWEGKASGLLWRWPGLSKVQLLTLYMNISGRPRRHQEKKEKDKSKFRLRLSELFLEDLVRKGDPDILNCCVDVPRLLIQRYQREPWKPNFFMDDDFLELEDEDLADVTDELQVLIQGRLSLLMVLSWYFPAAALVALSCKTDQGHGEKYVVQPETLAAVLKTRRYGECSLLAAPAYLNRSWKFEEHIGHCPPWQDSDRSTCCRGSKSKCSAKSSQIA